LHLRKELGLPEDATYTLQAVEIDVGFGRTLPCSTAWRCDHMARGEMVTRWIVHFTFDELCRSASGSSEWLGISQFADAILLTGVPKFASDDEDAARRFITFVDIVYDKQRFLTMTAEDRPKHLFAELVERYGGDPDSLQPHNFVESPMDGPIMKMPGHGVSSGRHGVVIKRPKHLSYSSSGAYVRSQDSSEGPAVAHATSETRTGGRAEHGAGDKNRVMTGLVQEDSDWIEWSATGLKDASLFDLSPTETRTQVMDKLLPFIRCSSRLHHMLPTE
jgi:predicted ATPase